MFPAAFNNTDAYCDNSDLYANWHPAANRNSYSDGDVYAPTKQHTDLNVDAIARANQYLDFDTYRNAYQRAH